MLFVKQMRHPLFHIQERVPAKRHLPLQELHFSSSLEEAIHRR